jgi:hypothetical protein
MPDANISQILALKEIAILFDLKPGLDPINKFSCSPPADSGLCNLNATNFHHFLGS